MRRGHRSGLWRFSFLLLPAFLIVCCTSSETIKDGGVPEPSYDPFYRELAASLWNLTVTGGDWADDQGDAAYYGLAYYINVGALENNAEYKARADGSRLRDLQIVRKANDDINYLLNNLEELLMAELGLIEYMHVTGDTAMRAHVDAFLDGLNSLVDSLGVYLDVGMDSWALQMYGPTTITGVIALLNLRYAELLGNDRKAERIAFGEKIIAAVDAKAWSGTFYRFKNGSDWLELYPNAMMSIANSLAFRLTQKEVYKTRSLAAFAGIQPLKDLSRKGYHSPYSAAFQGAKTDDYTTLSSQNYAIMMMAMLFEITGDAKFKQEITDIVSFVHDKLYVGGRLLHHWMDGRVAVPTDPEYFCSGCNLQFLYAIWYVEKNLYAK
jgi:hypothetical protein